MTPKIKNILIFTTIAVVFILIYIFFIKPSPAEPNLVSTSNNTTLPNIDGSLPVSVDTSNANAATEDFLALLLSVKRIKLDDTIFSDPSFISLHDSSIVLVQDGTQGRPNPFAQFGNDAVVTPPPAAPVCTPPQVLNTSTNTCVNPATN